MRRGFEKLDYAAREDRKPEGGLVGRIIAEILAGIVVWIVLPVLFFLLVLFLRSRGCLPG